MKAFFQVEAPPALAELPEVAFVEGRRVMGGKARLFHLLKRARDLGLELPVGRHRAPAGWVPRHFLVEPWSGGGEGLRRVRELRALGLSIASRVFEPPDGEGSHTTLWRLASSPASTDPVAAVFATRSPALPGSLRPLAGRRFRVAHHRPQGVFVCLRVAPGLQHALAPPRELARLAPAAARSAYLRHLRRLWREEILPDVLRRLVPDGATIWSDVTPWAVDALAQVLEAVGAERIVEAV